MITVLLAFVAGLATILNPCVLPLTPLVVAGAQSQSPRGPFALAAGLAVVFGLVGGTMASLGVEIGETAALRVPAALLLCAIGAALVVPGVADRLTLAARPLVGAGARLSERVSDLGLAGQAALGGLLALVWAPCIGPTMGAAIVLAASGGTRPIAFAAMTAFALGAATSLLLVGGLLRRLTPADRSRAMVMSGRLKLATGVLLILVGVGALTGADRLLEERMLDVMPVWLLRAASTL